MKPQRVEVRSASIRVALEDPPLKKAIIKMIKDNC